MEIRPWGTATISQILAGSHCGQVLAAGRKTRIPDGRDGWYEGCGRASYTREHFAQIDAQCRNNDSHYAGPDLVAPFREEILPVLFP